MKKILIPTDFSELAGYALEFASKLARTYECELHLLKIIPVSSEVDFGPDGRIMEGHGINVQALEAEKKQAENTIAMLQAASDLNIKGMVRFGQVIDTTLACAKEEGMSMIVMATHGIHGLAELWKGSNAERIVRQADIPVITLKCDRSQSSITRMALASDFLEKENTGVETLRHIRAEFGAALKLFTIKTPKVKESDAELMQRMQAFAATYGLEDAEFFVYPSDTVENGITGFVQSQAIDFLVMGTHGRKGLKHWLRGSIAEDLVNHAFLPIMTFKIEA